MQQKNKNFVILIKFRELLFFHEHLKKVLFSPKKCKQISSPKILFTKFYLFNV